MNLQDARNLILESQLLGDNSSKESLEVIQHLGYIQIDTIAVVERAHHQVIWTRTPSYKPRELDLLQRNKKIFEYWFHAASYLPMDDYRYSLPRMNKYREGKSHWFKQDKKVIDLVLKRIEKEGPLMSKDFEHTKKSSGWFDWKPTKIALEQLFMSGILMVPHRQGFQKVYDLAERVLPKNLDVSLPTEEELLSFHCISQLKYMGLATEAELCYQKKIIDRKKMKFFLEKLVLENVLEKVEIKNLKQIYYKLKQLEVKNSSEKEVVHILSPFDPLVIQRKRLKEIFNMDYMIECYTPEEKRRFGYFCHPLLYKGEFIGRVDLKAHRADKLLEVKGLFTENKKQSLSKTKALLALSLMSFAHFNGCEEIRYRT
jgi:uncharacterized protein